MASEVSSLFFYRIIERPLCWFDGAGVYQCIGAKGQQQGFVIKKKIKECILKFRALCLTSNLVRAEPRLFDELFQNLFVIREKCQSLDGYILCYVLIKGRI